MKKNTLDKIVMMLIALFTIVLEGKAQTKNDYYQMFWDKKIHYSEIPEDILSFVFREMHDDVQYNMGEIHCDAYEYKKNNPDAIRMFRGEYMIQYSWPIFNSLNKDYE